MKRSYLFFLSLISFTIVLSQTNDQQKNQLQEMGSYQHDGFYLSMSIGPLFGSISENVIGSYKLYMNGICPQLDFKIGRALNDRIILHATLISNMSVVLKTKISDNSSVITPNDLEGGEVIWGAGMTYYFIQNFFISSSFGLGKFTLYDSKHNLTTNSKRGFSMQIKIGKEWWISKNWGLGVGLSYGKTNLTDKSISGIEKKLDSNRFGLLFNTTFN